MKAFYEEKVGALEATIDQKEEERGDLSVELSQLRNGGVKKLEDSSNGVKIEDILRVRVSLIICIVANTTTLFNFFQNFSSCL